jgi:hypothetical protein
LPEAELCGFGRQPAYCQIAGIAASLSWNGGGDFGRHGPACPGHLYQHPAAIGGPEKPGHDGVAVSVAFPLSLKTL